MQVLQINCVYNKGSTGRIVSDLHRYYLAHNIDSYVVYGRGETSEDQNVIKVSKEIGSKARNIISRATGDLYGMAMLSTWQLQKTISDLDPDIVHLHCINGYFCNVFRLLSWLKSKRIPTVITQHAEFFYTGNCGYAFECEQWRRGCQKCASPKKAIGSANGAAVRSNWQRMRDAFEGFEKLQLIGVSDWISNRSNESGILGQYPCKTILNGLDTERFSFQGRNEHEGYEIIYVSPYFEDENKGGKWLLQLAEETESLPIHYTVIGRTEREYSLRNTTFKGVITNKQELARIYSNADVCVLTSKRETFSMVCAEALCCGTPVVGFEAGAPETVCIPEFSSFVPYGDLMGLKKALLEMLERKTDKAGLSAQARKKYSCETMAENYLAVYRQML